MELSPLQQREQAHLLLDVLPEEKLSVIHSLLEVMVEPLSRSLAMAPLDDEELRPEMSVSIQRSRDALARGEGIPHEEFLRELGL